MAVAPKKKEKESNYWERLATEMTRDILRRRRVRFKELSRALEAYGEDIPSTTLSNKINRGRFPLAFFLECLCAIHMSELRYMLPGMSEAELDEVRKVAAERKKSKRKPPTKKSMGIPAAPARSRSR